MQRSFWNPPSSHSAQGDHFKLLDIEVPVK